MVTGTLPYLGEANIKDPLYNHIKRMQPDLFWQTWREYFKSQEEVKQDDDEILEGFSTDENDSISK
jgi:hypothetical protein